MKFIKFKTFFSSLLLLLSINLSSAQETPCIDSTGVVECSAEYTLMLPSNGPALCGAQPCPPMVDNPSCATVAFSFLVDTIILADNSKKVVTTWFILDWCHAGLTTVNNNGQPLELPYLDLNNDGFGGDAYSVNVRNDSVFLDLPDEGEIFYAPYAGIMSYTDEKISVRRDLDIEVFSDANQNCAKNTGESGLADWQVRLISYPSETFITLKTDANGKITRPMFFPQSDESVDIFILSALNNQEDCSTSANLPLDVQTLAPINLSFPIYLQTDCQLLTVDLATPFLRRCFTNTYTVHYCNYSDESIDDGQVALKLDDFLTIESSEIPFTTDEKGIYFFDLAAIPAGFCDDFRFEVLVSCEAELGQTHCSEVQIYPNEICETIDPAWTGASIDIEGNCDQDSVRFKIKNTGGSDMLKESGFIVTEDVLMLRNGAFQLRSGEETEVVLAATGATYHLLAEQEDFHPENKEVLAFVEGCAGFSTPGLPNALRASKSQPYLSKDCQENIGAYDPNDKGAVPSGIGAAHYLLKNTDITYKIRFQNTGTDTAFNVVILDTLSKQLDVSSVIPGASSHDYQFQILRDSLTDAAILKFTFENIMLPDSFVNEPASNGFVQFLIAQQPNLEDGIRLENNAAIYFDFNEPVITNTVFHTIGMPLGRFVTSIPTQVVPKRSIKVQPNPFNENAMLSINGAPIKRGVLRLFSALGREVQQQIFSGNEVTIQRNNLPSGFYIYTVSADNQLLNVGKVQVSQK